MRYLASGRQMKMADQHTIQELGIPSMDLMERAAIRCVEVMEDQRLDLSRPCIVCGSGNNGGDGFAIARLLTQKGYPVTVCFVGNESHRTEETRSQMRLLKETGANICNEYKPGEYSIIIDAIFGVGLSREIIGRYLMVIRQMNEADAIKFAVDIPSGVSADEGCILGAAFWADITVTFQMEKVGLSLYPGKSYAGRVIVADIGIDTDKAVSDIDMAYTYEPQDYRNLLPGRMEDSNKGTYGRLLIVAGSKGMSGAAYLNAKAAYKAGAGLVQIYTPEDNRIILQELLPEAIVKTYDFFDEGELLRLLKWADTVCIGSGLGTSEKSKKILKTTLENVSVPCLIDADGLNLIAEHRKYIDRMPHNNFIITPHMKEMSRLTGYSVEELKSRRMEILKEFTEKHQVTCVLKDSSTVVASYGERTYINRSGNASMAKAGTGDVLAGIVAGLMAQGAKCYEAGILGAYLHGRAGDHARRDKGSYSVMAGDLTEYLSEAFKEQEEKDYEQLY